ncbi:MAG: hypothetical protein WAR79_20540 [Melioribacteraceae bacterium]|jgi:UDP-glucose 6-dehydrogenase
MTTHQLKTFLFFTFILSVSIYSLFEPDEPKKLMKKYYQNCEYEKVIEQAQIILKNSNLSNKEKSETYLIKGVAEFSSNKFLEARISFSELLKLNKSVKLDSNEVSPKIVKFFNELKIYDGIFN